MHRLVVYPRARAALLEAIAWNQEHDPGFAEILASTIEAALREIAERPMMWPMAKRHPTVRARHLRAIRYTIYYRVRANTVRIVGLIHMRRDPDAWKSRR